MSALDRWSIIFKDREDNAILRIFQSKVHILSSQFLDNANQIMLLASENFILILQITDDEIIFSITCRVECKGTCSDAE